VNVTEILLAAFMAELLEMILQYSSTLGGVVERLYRYYRRSVFIFLAIHTGHIYIIFLSLRYDLLNWPILLAIALKTFDIFSKIELIRQRYLDTQPDNISALEKILQMPIPLWLYAAAPLTYPWLIYLSLSSR